ncbi:NAD(P)H oxidase (H(2)O(2)-forming)/Kynurenine 3-monooxygenase, partial [Scytalidium lignicola]
MPAADTDSRIRLLKTSHVSYQHADLEKAKKFFLDFGMTISEEKQSPTRIYFQGYGSEPYVYVAYASPDGSNKFLGAAYTVESREELERATLLPGASSIEKLDAPGGGEKVTVPDPIGFSIHLVWGQTEKEVTQPEINPDKRAKPGKEPNVAHAAFEVHDFDVQHLGHDYLQSKGYKLCWGLGRHVIGSQIFDYWFDTSGFIVEHYADGDMVNGDTPVQKSLATPAVLSVWGPKLPTTW